MDIVLDFSIGYSNSYLAPLYAMWVIFTRGGWILVALAILLGLWWSWINWRKNIYNASIEFVLLAIDVPKENEQTPKAVENIFAHLHGIQKRGSLYDKIIKGYNQQGFSLEIISVGGYIQFLIRTPVQFRDLVEAAVYAQYPDAEITEVEDYTEKYYPTFPNNEYDIWGAHFKLEKKDVYPLKTYVAFQDPATKEIFKDPIGSLLEIFSRLNEGEQLWLQFVIVPPPNNKWRENGIRIIKKLIGAKSMGNGKKNLTWLPSNIVQGVSESLTASIVPPSDLGEEGKDEGFRWPTMMQHLTPSEKAVVESIGIKISKIAFVTKMRLIYLARKEVYNHRRLVPAVIGALKQYNTLDLNALKRDKKTKTKVTYPLIKSIVQWRQNNRKRRIMWGFKYRSGVRGRNPFILNTEELASLYHFPVSTVKAPLVKKTDSRKSEPPVSLPVEQPFSRPQGRGPITPKSTPPPTLPDDLEQKVPENLPFA